MSAQPGQEFETMYHDYLGEAGGVKKDQRRASRPFRMVMFALELVFGIIPMLAAVLGKMAPGAFWAGAIVALILAGIAFLVASNIEKKVTIKAAQSRPGFAEFFKLYAKQNYWTDAMVAGEKYDKFLSIIGQSVERSVEK